MATYAIFFLHAFKVRCSSSLLVVLKVKEDETATLQELDIWYVLHLSQYCTSMSFNMSMVSQLYTCTCIYSHLTPISRHSCDTLSCLTMSLISVVTSILIVTSSLSSITSESPTYVKDLMSMYEQIFT